MIDAEIYKVNAAETLAASRFSAFILSIQIFADEYLDGVCMSNSKEELGAVCLIVTDKDNATTFRLE